VKALHDLSEDDAEHCRWRLSVVGQPPPRRSRIDARDECEVGIRLFWEGHEREVAEMDSVTVDARDRPDRFCALFINNFAALGAGPQNLPVSFSRSSFGTFVHNTHGTHPHSRNANDDLDRTARTRA
jgi:hypothetical protein